MTDDTASSNVVGLRRVLRHMAKDKARGVVSSNPSREQEISSMIAKEAARLGFVTWNAPRLEPGHPVTLTNALGVSATLIIPPFGTTLFQPPTSAEVVNGGLAQAIDRYERAPRDAFDVFLACADAETVYDFLSETKMDGDRFVITVTATPRTT